MEDAVASLTRRPLPRNLVVASQRHIYKAHSLVVSENLLPGPTHPPKVKYSGGEGTSNLSVCASLTGPTHHPKQTGEHCVNTFVCDVLKGNGNEEYNDCNKKYKIYTDTDSDSKTEVITDINCKFNCNLMTMEVKVDPGSETNCIPLSHFRHLFPQLCRSDGKPKATALEPNPGTVWGIWWWSSTGPQMDHFANAGHNRDNKFHSVRFYVVDREEARILISHATVTWLGLIKALCKKAQKIKRQVASVTRKQSNSNNKICLLGPLHLPKVNYLLPGPSHPPKVKFTETVMERQQQD